MNISEIDEDFINVINKLDEDGFKPFASCDGVISHHKNPEDVTDAYIAFLKSEKIIDLMAVFMEDTEKYKIVIENDTYTNPYELYGNIISGNKYSVYFKNLNAENSKNFEGTVYDVIDKKIIPSEANKEKIKMIDEFISDSDGEELTFDFTFGDSYSAHMKKDGKINSLEISTKSGVGYMRDLSEIMKFVANKVNLLVKSGDNINEVYDEEEFITLYNNGKDAKVYFTDEHLKETMTLVKYLKAVEKDLKIKAINEPLYDRDEI